MSNSYDGSLSADFDASCAAHNEPDYCPVQCTVKHTFLHFHFLDETLGEDRPRLVRQSSDLRDARDLKSRRHIETLVPLTRHTAMHSCAYSDAKGNFSSGWEFGQKSLIVLRPSTPNAFEGDEEPSPAHQCKRVDWISWPQDSHLQALCMVVEARWLLSRSHLRILSSVR